jgi:hypothetical protein
MGQAAVALETVAEELSRRAPGLRVEITADATSRVLEARTPLIPSGVARVQVAYRPDGYVFMALEPIDRAIGATANLRTADAAAIADAIAEWATRPLRVQLPNPPPAAELRKRALNRIKAALSDVSAPPALHGNTAGASIDTRLVALHFPRDRRARMSTSAKVMIDVLAPGNPGRRSRCLFLRFDGNAFEAFESEEYVENQDYRWHRQRWRWQPEAALAPAPERWGVTDSRAAVAAGEQLERGEIEDGLAAFGIQTGDQLRKVLAGQPIGPLLADLASKWGTVAAEQLAAAAPWRLAPLATKTWMRVFGLGGSNAQVKPVVALGLRDRAPALEVMGLGSNRRLAVEDWQRSIDFEACRLGVALPPGLGG